LELIFDHGVTFTNKARIPAEEIAQTILATDSVVQMLPSILEKLLNGLHVDGLTTEVRLIKHSSPLIEDYQLKLSAKFQKHIEHYAGEKKLMRLSSDFFAAAKRDPNASVKLKNGAEVSNKAIQEMPHCSFAP